MVNIVKTNQPASLLQAIKNGVSLYDNLGKREMVDLRKKLLQDQGYICCYCQKRLPHKFIVKSKIEHFRCQENNPDGSDVLRFDSRFDSADLQPRWLRYVAFRYPFR
jgi:hypothetical protein